MQITEHWRGRIAIIAFPEPLDLDARTGPRLREMAKQVAEEGAETLVVDLGKVSFVDSAGLGALISAHKALRVKGGRLVLANPNSEVRQILEVTSLLRVFDLAASVADAVRSPAAAPR